ncbi:hypothetical protein ABZ618_01400 [Streptomyces roseolus]|uniref:hypothetical protein n=1 Tax=Streptomyces roseolus TaxID=67358 RepID=UPI0033EB41D1
MTARAGDAPGPRSRASTTSRTAHTPSAVETCAAVRLRTEATEGAGRRATGLAAVLERGESAQPRRRAVGGTLLGPPARAQCRSVLDRTHH